ncbi:T9SS type A sorting domain-containing protein [Rurimicrobium arvi]|uniref:Secretion system C-terminal sorting domain-containing protein n=1 Tax=Rurimicrobium arvi TaxID=2049916 RepID=A0ABP8MPJ8_9BACT
MNKNLLSLGACIALLNVTPATAKIQVGSTTKALKLHAGATPAEALKIAKAHTALLIEKQKAGSLKTGKTTAMDSRVIAYAYRESDGSTLSLTDSSHLKYSWGRGGDLKTTLKYDTMHNYTNGGTSAPLQLDSRGYAAYDANNNQTTVTNQVYNYSTLAYENSDRTVNTFNSSNLMVTTESQTWNGTSWDNGDMDKFTYNSAGKQLTDTSLTWSGSAYDYNSVIVTSYTGTGKESKLTIYIYAGVWLPYVSLDYTYNSSDDIATMLVKVNFSGTVLEDYQRATYTYDASKNPIFQDFEEFDGTTWSPIGRIASTFDASANLLDEYSLNWNSSTSTYDSSALTQYTYNTYNQETSETTYTNDGTGGGFYMASGDSRTNYYYEDFSPTAVKEISTIAADVKLFPIPAGDELSLQIAQAEAQSLDMQVVDIQGRSVVSRHYAAAKTISDKISVSNLPSGSYFVKLSNGTVRSFTVAH